MKKLKENSFLVETVDDLILYDKMQRAIHEKLDTLPDMNRNGGGFWTTIMETTIRNNDEIVITNINNWDTNLSNERKLPVMKIHKKSS